MARFDVQKYWWIFILIVGAIAVAILAMTQQWLPDYQNASALLAFGLVGISFYWAYLTDKERRWWAIIPGLSLLALIAAIISDYVLGTDPKNDWINVLVLGIGVLFIGIVVKRIDAKFVLFTISMFIFLVGIAMSPLNWFLKSALIAVDILVLAYYRWSNRNTLPKSP